jgi:5-methylcytosine-specific restriction endonuclease McrA
MIWPIPTPEEQVQFLRNVQRLLAEGLFVASYKFALVHALADLAVLKGDDSGAPLEIETREITAKFVDLYWRQSRPFQAGGEATGLIIQQNTGKQAAIIRQIVQSQQECGGSLFRFKQVASARWSALVTEVDEVVRTMPLWKLQTVGDERLEFLYENLDRGNRITLKPGVAFCFRAFYELVRDLIEGAWVRFVQKINVNKLGSATDLGTFLFGADRANLDAYRPILLDVQEGICLYCQKPLAKHSQVDHFVPWSRYPADLGHNFVLDHYKCNNAKSDFLAAENHLAAWIERNREHQAELQERLVAAALPCDLTATVQIAEWVYK